MLFFAPSSPVNWKLREIINLNEPPSFNMLQIPVSFELLFLLFGLYFGTFFYTVGLFIYCILKIAWCFPCVVSSLIRESVCVMPKEMEF